jgi:hypothetical protein
MSPTDLPGRGELSKMMHIALRGRPACFGSPPVPLCCLWMSTAAAELALQRSDKHRHHALQLEKESPQGIMPTGVIATNHTPAYSSNSGHTPRTHLEQSGQV